MPGPASLHGAGDKPKQPAAKLPPWQRLLKGEDARQAAQQLQRLIQLQAAGKFQEALPVAEALAALREKVQGKDHWQAVNARWEATTIGTALRKGSAAQKDLVRSYALYSQALGLLKRSRFRDTQTLLEERLAIRRKVLGENHPATAAAYNDVAYLQKLQGQYREAEAGYLKAHAILRKLLGDDHPYTAQSYNNLAVNLIVLGRYREAEQTLRQTLAIRRKVLGEEDLGTAQSYNSLAFNLNAQGRYAEAEEGYRTALAIYRKLLGDDHATTALAYNNLAANQFAQARYREAEEGHLKALVIRRKLRGDDDLDTASSYNNLAANHSAQKRYAEAEQGYRKALAIYRNLLGEDHPTTARCYGNLASDQYAQGRYQDAEDGFRKVLAIRRKLLGEEHPETVTSYYLLARNQHARGRYREAEELCEKSRAGFGKARLRFALSGLERSALTGELSPLPALAAILARNGKADDAWQRFEESLARGTWDDLSARLRRPAAEQERQAGLVARLDRLDQLIAATISANAPTQAHLQRREELLAQRSRTQADLDAFTHDLEQKYGPVAGQVIARAKIQASLPADAALVGWLDLGCPPKAADPNGEHWAVLLRSTGAPVWVRLRGSGPTGAWTQGDTRLTADLRAALQKPRGSWQQLARSLHQQRLTPLKEYLAASTGQPAVRQLIVLPSPGLAGVPAEVFADGYTVSYAFSGTLYAHLRKQTQAAGTGLLALADPVFDSSWPKLPGTRVEVEALRRLFADRSASKLLLDSDASEQALDALAHDGELGRYRYLHLATHGEVDDRVPLRSAVMLASDRLPDPLQQLEAGRPVYDGRLTAEEVLRNWHLKADLVTLSACQTALGKYVRGEGFVGFAQALILSGSRSVCLSLWKVDDAATALLMDRFYHNLLNQRADGTSARMTKAQALAEAKSWLRNLTHAEAAKRIAALTKGVSRGTGRPRQPLVSPVPSAAQGPEARPYAHPYYWAAFVLIGDER